MSIASYKDKLVKDLRDLADLIEHPEPGLSSWHVMCEETAKNVEEALKRARGR